MFVVNVEVFLRRGDRCLLIRRGGEASQMSSLDGQKPAEGV
jgi:hypothetical protein